MKGIVLSLAIFISKCLSFFSRFCLCLFSPLNIYTSNDRHCLWHGHVWPKKVTLSPIYLGQKLSCNIEKNNLRQFGRCPSGKNENPENHSILQSKPIHVHPGGELQNCYGSDFAGGNVSCHLVPVLTGYLSRQSYWQSRDNLKYYLCKNTFKIPHQPSAHKKASVIQKL